LHAHTDCDRIKKTKIGERMTLEKAVVNEAVKAAQTTLKTVENGMKKAWSVMDAASEKQRPGEVLSQQAVRAIQGRFAPDA
jgi:hypothetical protein